MAIEFVRGSDEPGCDPCYYARVNGVVNERFEIQYASYLGSHPYVINEYDGSGPHLVLIERGVFRTFNEAKTFVLGRIAN